MLIPGSQPPLKENGGSFWRLLGGSPRVVNETFKLQTLCSSHVHHPCYGETTRKFCIHKIRQFFCTWVCLFDAWKKVNNNFPKCLFFMVITTVQSGKISPTQQTTVKKRYLFTMKLHHLTPNGPHLELLLSTLLVGL